MLTISLLQMHHEHRLSPPACPTSHCVPAQMWGQWSSLAQGMKKGNWGSLDIISPFPAKTPSDKFWQTLRKRRWEKKPNLNPLKLTILANELKECRIYRYEFQCLQDYEEVVSIQELWELIRKCWIEDYIWTFKKADSTLWLQEKVGLGQYLHPDMSPQGDRCVVDSHPQEEGPG